MIAAPMPRSAPHTASPRPASRRTTPNHTALPPVLTVTAVTREFYRRRVLGPVTFERASPGVVGILGGNGSGKTTLLRCIMQLTRATSGELHVCDRNISGADDTHGRRLVGFAPHSIYAWLDRTVHANIVQAGRLGGLTRTEARAAAATAIAHWNLSDVADSPVQILSRGWQQRYALARADVLTPPILLLDEPTVGLDDAGRALLHEALDSWLPSRIVIVTSHERAWLTERADQLVDLDQHQLVTCEDGRPA